MKDIYKKINNLINSGEFDKANILLLPLLKNNPNDFHLVQSQFLVFLSKNDEVNALKSLYKMSELKEHYVVYNNIGNLEKNFGNYEAAIENFEKAIQLDDNKPEIFYNLANVYSKINKRDKSIIFYEKALNLNPEYSAALNNVAAEYLKLEDLKNARDNIIKSLIIDSKSVEALLNSVLISIYEKSYNEAIKLLSKAYNDGITDERIIFYLVILNSYLGKDDDLDNLLSELSENNSLYIKLSAWKKLYSQKSSNFSISKFKDDIILQSIEMSNKSGLFLEFGVAGGYSINLIAKRVENNVHGFDSFEGLNEEWNGQKIKAFSLEGEIPKVENNVIIHRGYFDETVEPFFKKNSEKISFLHIDCDLYSSTQTVLNASIQNLTAGSIILFDEMIGYDGFENHEFKAFVEFVDKNKINFECICMSYLTGQVLIKILSL
jgi:tetratricopeptide (TPR) repeat protein